MAIDATSFQGGGIIKLAPDLTFPSSIAASDNLQQIITGIDGSAGYATALSLSGRFKISYARFEALTNEVMNVRLTVDGVLIWDDALPNPISANRMQLINQNARDGSFVCETSLLLEILTTSDTSVDLYYLVRPIL